MCSVVTVTSRRSRSSTTARRVAVAASASSRSRISKTRARRGTPSRAWRSTDAPSGSTTPSLSAPTRRLPACTWEGRRADTSFTFSFFFFLLPSSNLFLTLSVYPSFERTTGGTDRLTYPSTDRLTFDWSTDRPSGHLFANKKFRKPSANLADYCKDISWYLNASHESRICADPIPSALVNGLLVMIQCVGYVSPRMIFTISH